MQGTNVIKDLDLNNNSYYFNRELSWLKFNNRVLEEAMDESVPVIERLKFISILNKVLFNILS